MNTREKLLSDLREIQQNEYRLENREKLKKYGDLMLEFIGDPDPELRDILMKIAGLMEFLTLQMHLMNSSPLKKAAVKLI